MSLARNKVLRSGGRLRSRPYRKAGTRAALINLLDVLCSQYVRKLHKRCVTCGTTENLTASHFYRRAYLSIRWDLRNVTCQCMPCNVNHSKSPWAYTSWFLDTYSDEVMSELHALRMKYKRWTDDDLLAMAGDFKRMIKELR